MKPNRVFKKLFLLIALFFSIATYSQNILVPYGATWKYLDNGTNQGTAWRAPAFADGSWATGPSELGYGDGGEATVVGFGPDANNKYITTYFRHTVNIPNVSFKRRRYRPRHYQHQRKR